MVWEPIDSAQLFGYDVAMNIGTRVRQEREKRGWSRDKLAMEVGVHRNTIAHIENGKFAPKLDTLMHLERVLGIQLYPPKEAGDVTQ